VIRRSREERKGGAGAVASFSDVELAPRRGRGNHAGFKMLPMKRLLRAIAVGPPRGVPKEGNLRETITNPFSRGELSGGGSPSLFAWGMDPARGGLREGRGIFPPRKRKSKKPREF